MFRDFPLNSIHQYAQKAAEASECADDQGKFWEYHDLLYENQSALDVDSLKGYAAELGLDTATFNDCLDNGKQTAEVDKDSQDAQSYGAPGTPVFFVNGELIWSQSYTEFSQIIGQALEEEGG